MNFTLCKNRCNYTKRNKQSRNSPLSVQPFQNRTIPCFAPSRLTYERSVGFASLQSPWAFNFGHPCPSLVKGEVLSPERIRATTGEIVLHPPTSPSPQPLQKDNNPSPHVCPFIQYYNTSINHQSVHRLIRQSLEQLHRKTGTKCRNNSTLPCSHYREIKQQQ